MPTPCRQRNRSRADFEQSVNLTTKQILPDPHLKLLESKIKELNKGRSKPALIAGHFVPNHVGQATAYSINNSGIIQLNISSI